MAKFAQKIGNFEAEKVPERKEHEADKDLEQRYGRVLAWLVDVAGVYDLDFDIKKQEITWKHKDTPEDTYIADAGEWIVIGDHMRPRAYKNQTFKSMFVEI